MTAAKTSTAKTSPTPAADAVKQIEEAVAVHKETIESVVKAGADVASKSLDKVVGLSKEQSEAAHKAHTAAFKGYEDALAFSKANIDALVSSSSILVRGTQELSKSLLSLAQIQIEDSIAAGKALFGVKSPRELFELSSTLVKSHLEKTVAETTKLQQASQKLAEESLAPLNSRVEAVVAKVTKTAA